MAETGRPLSFAALFFSIAGTLGNGFATYVVDRHTREREKTIDAKYELLKEAAKRRSEAYSAQLPTLDNKVRAFLTTVKQLTPRHVTEPEALAVRSAEADIESLVDSSAPPGEPDVRKAATDLKDAVGQLAASVDAGSFETSRDGDSNDVRSFLKIYKQKVFDALQREAPNLK